MQYTIIVQLFYLYEPQLRVGENKTLLNKISLSNKLKNSVECGCTEQGNYTCNSSARQLRTCLFQSCRIKREGSPGTIGQLELNLHWMWDLNTYSFENFL